MYEYKANIINVFDGDTCTAVLDLGCHVKIERPIRLHGIDTPEVRGDTKLAGLEARDFLRELILNKDVYIQTFKDRNEKYGRLLGKIYLSNPSLPDAVLVNDLLVREGYAVAYME